MLMMNKDSAFESLSILRLQAVVDVDIIQAITEHVHQTLSWIALGNALLFVLGLVMMKTD